MLPLLSRLGLLALIATFEAPFNWKVDLKAGDLLQRGMTVYTAPGTYDFGDNDTLTLNGKGSVLHDRTATVLYHDITQSGASQTIVQGVKDLSIVDYDSGSAVTTVQDGIKLVRGSIRVVSVGVGIRSGRKIRIRVNSTSTAANGTDFTITNPGEGNPVPIANPGGGTSTVRFYPAPIPGSDPTPHSQPVPTSPFPRPMSNTPVNNDRTGHVLVLDPRTHPLDKGLDIKRLNPARDTLYPVGPVHPSRLEPGDGLTSTAKPSEKKFQLREGAFNVTNDPRSKVNPLTSLQALEKAYHEGGRFFPGIELFEGGIEIQRPPSNKDFVLPIRLGDRTILLHGKQAINVRLFYRGSVQGVNQGYSLDVRSGLVEDVASPSGLRSAPAGKKAIRLRARPASYGEKG